VDWKVPLAQGVQVMSLVELPVAATYVPTGQEVDTGVHALVLVPAAEYVPVAHATTVASLVAVHALVTR
jgi:hypothetical protein